MTESGFFRCLGCTGREVTAREDGWQCRGCGRHYPVVAGVPVLVREWQSHAATVASQAAVRPEWYDTAQPSEAASPWRHHVRKRREYVQAAIADHLQRAGRTRARTLLDLGCGDGQHLHYLSPFAEATYGSDYNLQRLIRARSRHPGVSLFLADVLDYPAADDFFDIIFFNHVIEHIAQDELALRSVRRLLAPGGLLVLGTPNEGAGWWRLAYRLEPQLRRTTDHVQFYTAGTLTSTLGRAGFAVVSVHHMGWGPPHFTLDSLIRRYRWVDDTCEWIGRRFFPRQASSLYVLATKAA
jgi:SAM-dependent methyltransferase